MINMTAMWNWKKPGWLLWLLDIAFAVDVVGHLDSLNISLQGKGVFAHGLYWNLKAFQAKLQLFCTQMQYKVYLHFPTLNTVAVTEEANVKYAAMLAGLCPLSWVHSFSFWFKKQLTGTWNSILPIFIWVWKSSTFARTGAYWLAVWSVSQGKFRLKENKLVLQVTE